MSQTTVAPPPVSRIERFNRARKYIDEQLNDCVANLKQWHSKLASDDVRGHEQAQYGDRIIRDISQRPILLKFGLYLLEDAETEEQAEKRLNDVYDYALEHSLNIAARAGRSTSAIADLQQEAELQVYARVALALRSLLTRGFISPI